MRTETRTQRYRHKLNSAIKMPVEIATVNFKCEENVAYLIRAAACFGASAVNVIGSCPASGLLRELSGTTSDLIKIRTFQNPHDLLVFAAQQDYDLVSAELADDAHSIHNFKFNTSKKTCIVIGHEQLGVPEEIVHNSSVVYIPMPGFGYSLNAAQSGNVMLYEYARQYANRNTNV